MIKMKSKSFDLKRNTSEKIKQNQTFDFSKYYTSAAETKTVLEQSGLSSENHVKESKNVNKKLDLPFKRERSPKKKKNKLEPLEISHIDIEGPSLNATAARNSFLNESKLTSTPRTSAKNSNPKVKSIMKNKMSTTGSDEHLETSQYSPNKPKKRNKSVSFLLDDTEETVVKKTKSNDSIDRKQDTPNKHDTSKELGKLNKPQDNKKDVKGKENKRNDNFKLESEITDKVKKAVKIGKDERRNNVSNLTKSVSFKEKKDKFKKIQMQNSEENIEDSSAGKEEGKDNEDQIENKNRRAKKKKHLQKQNTETEVEGEPVAKYQKKQVKPEAIVENLESLSIGDNAHTLTNLLDEMTVAEKDKRKKHKNKLKKAKKPLPGTSNGDTEEPEKTEEVKEKVKWQKRKWNKDKKGDVEGEGKSSVIVDNLPLAIVCNYKKQLVDYFKKHGDIKSVGVAETYPAEDSKPVFSTSIHFCNDEAASEALKEDNATVFGSRIRVRPQLPATETTLVVRSYAELTDQSVSSAFAAAGKVRSIRHLVKGRKSIATAFVEFDGPDALQKALKMSENTRIAGKKVHVSRFEVRRKPKPANSAAQKDTDSEDSD